MQRTFPAYQTSPHHARIAEALEAVERGELPRLMIDIPPRHGKSELVSVRFPAWYIGRHPDRHIIACSYAASLAYTFSRAARNLLATPEWPWPQVSLAADAQGVEEWLTTAAGGYVAAGVGGPITGKGADLLLIDDPVKNREDADSPVVRQAQWDWYTSTARTRLQPLAAIVLCMTRWHDDDLGGRLLAAQRTGGERWEVLRLPALAEEADPLGREQGQALWPEWFDGAALETIRRTIGPRDWAALYQQRPYLEEGAKFRRQWFTRIEEQAPEGLRWVRYWDLAASTKTDGDRTVGARCAFDREGTLWIGSVLKGRWEWPDALAVVTGTAQLDGRACTIGIEGIGVQRGFRQFLLREPTLRAYSVVDVPVLKDKALRATPWQTRAEIGKVALVRGPWIGDFLDEVCAFPQGEHDDQVDAVSGAVQMLATAAPARVAAVRMG